MQRIIARPIINDPNVGEVLPVPYEPPPISVTVQRGPKLAQHLGDKVEAHGTKLQAFLLASLIMLATWAVVLIAHVTDSSEAYSDTDRSVTGVRVVSRGSVQS